MFGNSPGVTEFLQAMWTLFLMDVRLMRWSGLLALSLQLSMMALAAIGEHMTVHSDSLLSREFSSSELLSNEICLWERPEGRDATVFSLNLYRSNWLSPSKLWTGDGLCTPELGRICPALMFTLTFHDCWEKNQWRRMGGFGFDLIVGNWWQNTEREERRGYND